MRTLTVPERAPEASGRPRRRAGLGRRLLTGGVAAGVLAAVTFIGGGAGAQDIQSLRNRAQQVADDLERLERRSSELNEQYLETSEQLRELEAELAENRESVEEARGKLDESRGQAADYLVRAYMDAGSRRGVAPGASDPNEAVNSQVMLEELRRGRDSVAEDYRAQKVDLETRTAALDAAAKRRETDAADVFLNTNRGDNTPGGVIEACAAGLPVVATAVGGIPYMLRDGEDALLVPDDDDEAMAAAVLRLFDTPALVRRLSESGRRLAEGCAWPVVRAEWERVIADVAAQGAAPPVRVRA